MQKKSTKKALLMSLLSLVVCISMLVGSTFAWFTDSVTSANNIIQSGNLDVELEYSTDLTNWDTVTSTTNVFKDGALWEPGYTEVVYLRVSNKGSLALKYNLGMHIVEETAGVNMAGDAFKLSDSIMYGVEGVDAAYADRAAAVASVKESATVLSTDKYVNGELLAKTATAAEYPSDVVAMVVYMPETVGNEANHNGKNAPEIKLGIELFATQATVESDSFGTDYDKAAPWTGAVNTDWYFDDPDATEFTIESAEELAGFAAIVNGIATTPSSTFALRAAETVQDSFVGKTVKLDADLDLKDIPWTPIGRIGDNGSTDFSRSFKGTFDGQGHVIYNLYVNNSGWAGLFGLAHGGATINNVKLSGVTIMSNRMAGSVVGQLYGSVDNCHVEKANIIVIPNAVEGGFDNGDKVGGIVGWLGDNGNNRTLTNCSVTETEVSAYRDVGGIAGYVASSTTVSGNSVEKVDVIADQTTNNYGDKAANAGLIYGRTSGAINDNGTNTNDEESTIEATYNENGLTFRSDGEEVALYLVPAEYKYTTVTVPEGVETIGGYAFAYNDNIEKIVLPSSVTTLNDRAFRDTSASEVVLNEGLKSISYQAFRNASNVKTVAIPSTVTTIGKEAFQNSGIKTLTVPASVTTVEYGAMRDMKKLESVTIEGNVDIPVYAFRACTNLKKVILKGDDVTFGGGSRGMIFTNKENGDGSAITVYVANETVKERLLAADTAAKDYGGYKIVIAEIVSDADKLQEVLSGGGNVILKTDVNTEAATTAPYGNKYAVKLDGGVIEGNGNELYMECYGDDYGIMTSGGTVKNLTIKEGCRAVMIMYPQQDVILDNVNIGGDGVLYPINTGEAGADGVKLIVTNSVLAGWTSFSNIESASFTNVKFEQGTYYNNIYGRVLKPYVNTTLTNCSFVKAMNLDLSGLVLGHKIVIKNCTVDGKALNASVMTIPATDAQYDTELFTVDLPSWASSISDCIEFQ